ncbi:LLM class flavin-dependent oxidoreductase [Oceanobacillus jeddahense]|uniref:LLM class flavin-dependent oxidoreductase n=1 Tax=Oceanobacillus jeddahense TaxID=1462527 RepID=A0ABY5JWK4_9BACI|nr:LLM class flavin-dependent oxidoreductase [Oceanobacillus jeddahense]UUI04180.1 LLM class flavin-dependent oxidoreductase [Oceanobacillus jeddahense]
MRINIDQLQFILDTFGDITYKDETKERMSYEESLRNTVKEAKLADEYDVDAIALGEHHCEEHSVSSPETVLTALSLVTKNITLGTGVTVLSSDDPVRLYERFATIDALSNGRAQMMIGRGAYTESFPLFGYDLRDYNELFEEKIALLNELIKNEPVTWKGNLTQSLDHVQVYPKLEKKLDVVVGVGGTPESIVRVAKYNFPVVLAISGGDPARFKPFVDLYHRTTHELGKPPQSVGMHSLGVIAETDEEVKEIAWDYIKATIDRVSKERGGAPMKREHFEYEVNNGAYFVGSPETVAQKIAHMIPAVGVQRFNLVYSVGGQLQKHRFQTIRLYGEKVIPRVKKLLKEGINRN